MAHDPSILMLSGSYLINGALLLGIGHVWRTATASKKALHDRLDVHGASLAEAHKKVAVLEARHDAQVHVIQEQGRDIREIKDDVKTLLSRNK